MSEYPQGFKMVQACQFVCLIASLRKIYSSSADLKCAQCNMIVKGCCNRLKYSTVSYRMMCFIGIDEIQ